MPAVIFFACLDLERKSSLINRLMLRVAKKNERNPMMSASIFRTYNASRATGAAAAAAGQPVVLKGS
jgi:hypothetical protein